MKDLIEKYNVAVPRYTSYPTVPNWQADVPFTGQWMKHVVSSYIDHPELSLYIHLPFCEALCTYCGCNKRITKNHAVEAPYIEAVLNEWRIYRSYFQHPPVIKEIHLGGGTPTFFAPEQLERLISTILDDAVVADDHAFSFEAHPSSTTEAHLQTLFDLGFERISVGVQDVSPEILTAINRHQTVDQVAFVTEMAREIGYTSVNYDIIYGLPFQKAININQTIDFIADHKPDRIAFYSYAHVPWVSAAQRAFTLDNVPVGKEKNELYQLGKNRLTELGYDAIGMDHFCLPDEALNVAYHNGRMHRNFMGYTPNYTKCSIALGTSSISDSWDMYVQNNKTVEGYMKAVNNGMIPIVKGHVLSNDDQVMRQHILNLMCKDYTSWDATNPIPGIDYDALSEMEKDGLLEYGNNFIRVLDAGKYFIRNICSAIDPQYQLKESTSMNKYSKAI